MGTGMDGTRLGNAITAVLQGLNPELTGAELTKIQNLWQAIGKEVVKEVQNAQVAAGIAVQVVPSTGTGATNAPGSLV